MDIADNKKKETLREKIKAQLAAQGKNAEEHIEAIEKFLSTLPSEHIDSLMEKLEELEGENVEETIQTDPQDAKTTKNASVIEQIRDELAQGDMEDATSLAKSLHVITE